MNVVQHPCTVYTNVFKCIDMISMKKKKNRIYTWPIIFFFFIPRCLNKKKNKSIFFQREIVYFDVIQIINIKHFKKNIHHLVLSTLYNYRSNKYIYISLYIARLLSLAWTLFPTWTRRNRPPYKLKTHCNQESETTQFTNQSRLKKKKKLSFEYYIIYNVW